jgi:cytoskeletal protein CcmA (bactofilin family)
MLLMSVAKRLQDMGKKKEVTLIATDAELVGDIAFSSQLIVNCLLRGTTTAEEAGASMTVSPGGRVVGDIRAPSVLIHGRVDGTVYALEHLEIADGAIIQGDLHYSVLQMHMGASVQGRLIHSVPDEAEKPTSPAQSGRGDVPADSIGASD